MLELILSVIVVYFIITIALVVAIETSGLLYDLIDFVEESWYLGNVFGKTLLIIITIMATILMLPALCICFAILIVKSIFRGIIDLGFPQEKRSFRKEIAIPSVEIMQSLRDQEIYFTIGKNYIAFESYKDYRKAQKILEE